MENDLLVLDPKYKLYSQQWTYMPNLGFKIGMTSRWCHDESYTWRHWRDIEPWPKLKVARNDKYAILWFKIKFLPASFNQPIFPTRFGFKNRRGAFSSFLISCHWWHCNLRVREVWWSFIWTEFFTSEFTRKFRIWRVFVDMFLLTWHYKVGCVFQMVMSSVTTIGKTHPTL